MKNWRDVSDEPNAPAVRAFVQTQLTDADSPRVESFQIFTAGFVRGRSVLDGMVIENAEHVDFIIPYNALEIATRAGVKLTAPHHFGGGGYSSLMRVLISLLKMPRLIKYELFARSYINIFQVAPR
jgi:hypothetical protein